jgi:predicted O-linked N-acetylglucosamine transferase (SPINDLY family)
VRFALCQQSMKFDPQDDALLARIAREVASSEFWIVESNKHPWATEQLVERLSATFAAEGLDPNRHIRTTPWMNPDEFLGFLDAMDVMLDCPGFSGYTTAWQALHRGIPIVTLEGRFMRQRLAAGLLRQIGHEGSIASDREAYVARAIEFAERTRNQQAQQSLRHNLMHAAAHADGNIAANRAMEETLLAA